ncbi:CPBP family intramembrane glutamic endopeptidase [Hamadaea tsunoensis]|uniref:CPBP family intramembrane glutamic endopeptidase n=1 Tax=Hamadaea tsunoensis TaxID=53368 RepID=UPI0003F9D719|nr:CPBP family intramembrane glutamic endopeptidase [Hamadaea tsunoensis]
MENVVARRRTELLLVLALSLGQSAVYSIVDIVAKLTRGPLSGQTTALNTQASPRAWLDITYQLLGIFFALVIVGMAYHLLGRDPGRPRLVLGLTPRRLGFDFGGGALLAAVIGLPGLAFYYFAVWLGINTEISTSGLRQAWWAVPILILSAIQNAILEEVIVVGYMITRLRQMKWSVPATIAASSILRGSYHLYQGFGGFLGNVVMGVVFSLVFLRWRRVGPLIVAHSLLDIVAFVGYQLFLS